MSKQTPRLLAILLMTEFNGKAKGKERLSICLAYTSSWAATLWPVTDAVQSSTVQCLCPTYAPGPDEDHVIGTTLHRLEPPQFLLRRGADLVNLLLQGSLNVIFILFLLTSRETLLRI